MEFHDESVVGKCDAKIRFPFHLVCTAPPPMCLNMRKTAKVYLCSLYTFIRCSFHSTSYYYSFMRYFSHKNMKWLSLWLRGFPSMSNCSHRVCTVVNIILQLNLSRMICIHIDIECQRCIEWGQSLFQKANISKETILHFLILHSLSFPYAYASTLSNTSFKQTADLQSRY